MTEIECTLHGRLVLDEWIVCYVPVVDCPGGLSVCVVGLGCFSAVLSFIIVALRVMMSTQAH